MQKKLNAGLVSTLVVLGFLATGSDAQAFPNLSGLFRGASSAARVTSTASVAATSAARTGSGAAAAAKVTGQAAKSGIGKAAAVTAAGAAGDAATGGKAAANVVEAAHATQGTSTTAKGVAPAAKGIAPTAKVQKGIAPQVKSVRTARSAASRTLDASGTAADLVNLGDNDNKDDNKKSKPIAPRPPKGGRGR
ncbi:MAG: hypothetical protein K2X93_14790 [Candidatus Obscuribacterales bacterium]|nr:hypothetical protein [Candidatus Obscuribacterales bacterium]